MQHATLSALFSILSPLKPTPSYVLSPTVLRLKFSSLYSMFYVLCSMLSSLCSNLSNPRCLTSYVLPSYVQISHSIQTIIPAATVSNVASSTKTKLPVMRLSRYSSIINGLVVRRLIRAISFIFKSLFSSSRA